MLVFELAFTRGEALFSDTSKLTCAMVALIMGCTNNDELQNVPSNYPADNIIRVTAGVNNPMTRGGETGTTGVTPYNGDFSLTVFNGFNSKYTYTDKRFTYADATGWNCSETLLWQNAITPVEIAAIAPYDDSYKVYDDASGFTKVFSYTLKSDQTTQDAQNKNDLLYYYNDSFTPNTGLTADGKLALTLNHAFCLFDIQVTLGTEFNTANGLSKDQDPIASATIKGIYNSATINVWGTPVVSVVTEGETGVRGNITATPGDFTAVDNEKANATKKFSCIVLPQTLSKDYFTVTLLTTTGKKYEWSPTEDITIKSGKKYTLKLTMGDDKLVLKEEGITAKAWADGTGGSLETD